MGKQRDGSNCVAELAPENSKRRRSTERFECSLPLDDLRAYRFQGGSQTSLHFVGLVIGAHSPRTPLIGAQVYGAVKQGGQLAPLRLAQIHDEDAFLHTVAVALQQVHHPAAAALAGDVVADEHAHGRGGALRVALDNVEAGVNCRTALAVHDAGFAAICAHWRQ